jgi:hypothetical protein
MLSVKSYDAAYVEQCRNRIAAALSAIPDNPIALNELVVAIDASFVHRMRGLEGKDGNPLNEVRMLANSILTNQAVLAADSTIKYSPQMAVTGVSVGEAIALDKSGFERLVAAFLHEIRLRFA